MDEMNDIVNGTKKIRNIILLVSSTGCLPFFLMFFVIIVSIFAVLGLFSDDSNSSSIVRSNGSECGFTISETSLSKKEFKEKIEEYAKTHTQWQKFVSDADDYYDYAKAQGVNPELVITVAGKEGGGNLSCPGKNNYWGLGAPNGSSSCDNYDTLLDGAKAIINSASKYESLSDWFYKGHYSWIGDYWYTLDTSHPEGDGGCYYAPYIYPDNMPDRVKKACAEGAPSCTIHGDKSRCTATVDEDQLAYANWLVEQKMGTIRKSVFGLEFDEGISCSIGNSNGSGSDFVESYVQWMIDFAADDSHGYSQNTRDMNPNVDCSSFVYYALKKGAQVDNSIMGTEAFSTTWRMDEVLTSAGFKAYKFTSTSDLQRGDILWSASHTEVYVGDGKNVGAHSNYDGKDGDSSGKEVNVASSNKSDWTYYYRYET